MATPRVTAATALVFFVAAGLVSGSTDTTLAAPPHQTAAGGDVGLALELVEQVGGDTTAIETDGHYAYVGVGPRIVILDLQAPDEPTIVGRSNVLAGVVGGVAVSDGYAYVGTEKGGLAVIDVSDPAAPHTVARFDTPGTALRLAVVDGVAFVADGEAGLQIIDMSRPRQPSLLATYESRDPIVDVAVAGGYAYLAERRTASQPSPGALRVLDVGDPRQPREVAAMYADQEDPWPYAVTAVGNRVYFALWNSLRIIDATDPANPRETGFVSVKNPFEIVVVGGLAYVAGYGEFAPWCCGVTVFDVSDPTAPLQIGTKSVSDVPRSLAAKGDRVYVTVAAGVNVIDASDPAGLRTAGVVDTGGEAYHVAVVGSHAYVADGASRGRSGSPGFRVFDIASPDRASLVGALDTGAQTINFGGLAESGGFVYATMNEGGAVTPMAGGLIAIDGRQSATPRIEGSIPPLTWRAWPARLAATGDYAYVAAAGLRAIDISSPDNLHIVGEVDTPGATTDVAVSGPYAYVADGLAPAYPPRADHPGLHIVDVGDPSELRLVGSLETEWVQGVAVAGGYAYLAVQVDRLGTTGGLRVVDVSDPTQPIQVGAVDVPAAASAVAVADGLVYLAVGEQWSASAIGRAGSLYVFDVSAPTIPRQLSVFDAPADASEVTVVGDRVFVAGTRVGLLILHSLRESWTAYLPIVQRD